MIDSAPTEATPSATAAVWVWDPERLRIVWANELAVAFWGETSVEDLLDRDFAPYDEAVRDFNDLMHAVLTRQTGRVSAQMVLAPTGTPVRVDCRAARIQLEDGRLGVKIEAVGAPVGGEAEVDRLREIVERTPVAISLFAEDGSLLMQNAAAEHSFGAELKTLAERYGDRQKARDAMRALLVNGSHSQAAPLRTQVGERRHRLTMRRIHDPVSAGMAAIVFFTDIADRGAVPLPGTDPDGEEAQLLSNLDAGAIVFDDSLRVRFLSEAARQLMFHPGPDRDSSLATLFPEKREQIAASLARILEGQAESVDLRLGMTDGFGASRWLRMEIRARTWRGEQSWLATLTDITEERRVALSLRRTLGERDTALESLGIGVATLLEDGTVETISEAGAAMLGAAPSDLVGKPFDASLGEIASGTFREALAAPAETERPLAIDPPVANGTPLGPLRLALGARNPERGGRRMMVLAERAGGNGEGSRGAARSEAIARASHELRTPLNAIIGFTQIMLDDTDAIRSETYREYLKDIHDSGQYMARLVQDMLDMRRIEAGALSLEPGPVNLANLIRRVARDLEGAARARDVTIAVSLDDALPTLIADAHTLRQALTNLAGNAVKFTDDTVRIVAGLHSSGALRIDVIDNGEGMTEDERDRALQPYAQGRHSSRKFGGAGMGLPLAKGFIEANRGHFELVSRKGEGTQARIVFPPRLVAPPAQSEE